MSFRRWKQLAFDISADLDRKYIFDFAAALSYYFVVALFPALLALSALLAYLPIPDMFNTIVGTMARVVPPSGMALVRQIVGDVVLTHHGAVLSFSLIGALWTCSSGFSAMIDALNVAYDVPETRTLWRTRLITLELTFLVGTLIVVAFAAMIVGPQFGEFLAGHMGFTWSFAHLWPLCRFVLSALFIILAVECVYFLAPNIKQRFLASLPGATLAVVGWLVLSEGLSFYFRKLAHLNRTYGTVGGVIALLVWLYWTGFMVLLGADTNARILKRRGRELEIKQPVQETEELEAPPHSDTAQPEIESAPEPPSKILPPSK